MRHAQFTADVERFFDVDGAVDTTCQVGMRPCVGVPHPVCDVNVAIDPGSVVHSVVCRDGDWDG